MSGYPVVWNHFVGALGGVRREFKRHQPGPIMEDWLPLDDRPHLGKTLPMPPVGAGGDWHVSLRAHEAVYVHVLGEGGPTAYLLTVYVVPADTVAMDGDGELCLAPAGAPRLPTIEELWAIADRFTLEGSLLAPVGPGGAPSLACSGSPPPPFDPLDGTAIQMRQIGALDGSPAALRWRLASPQPIPTGMEIVS